MHAFIIDAFVVVTGGLLVILETVLKPDKTGPAMSVFFDVIMMVRTPGRERSVDEYKSLVVGEGFEDFRFTSVGGSSSYDVVVARKMSK